MTDEQINNERDEQIAKKDKQIREPENTPEPKDNQEAQPDEQIEEK